MNKRIYLSSPHMSDEGYERKYVKEAFDSNWLTSIGENIDEFETAIKQYVGVKAAVSLASGTAAIHMALKAAGVGDGDIVFCSSFTFAATANPIIYERAKPVFIDSDQETWNMCPKALKAAFEKYPDVKAVIVVHLYGLAAEMDEIVALCKEHDVALIEDAAEALGTYYKGKHVGTFGDYGIFSFNGNKIITTSGGGMLVSNHEERIEKVRFWSTQSKDAARYYQHSELGFNYRMSNVLAGIGRGQMKVLNERVKQKQSIFSYYKQKLGDLNDTPSKSPNFSYYKQKLGDLDGVSFMPVHGNDSNCWLSCLTLSGNVRPFDVMNALEALNIESRCTWKPMHMQPFFEKYDYIGLNVSEKLFENGICLPSDTKMSEDDLERVTDEIQKLW